jgi:hypothetical protein
MQKILKNNGSVILHATLVQDLLILTALVVLSIEYLIPLECAKYALHRGFTSEELMVK